MPPKKSKRWSKGIIKRTPGDSQSEVAPSPMKRPRTSAAASSPSASPLKAGSKKDVASPSPPPMKTSPAPEGAASPHKRSSAKRAAKAKAHNEVKRAVKALASPKPKPKAKGTAKGKPKAKVSAKAQTSNSHPGRVFKGLLRPKSHDTVLKRVMKIQMTKLSSAELEQLVANMKAAAADSGFKVSSGCTGSNMSFIVLKTMCEILQVPMPRDMFVCEQDGKKQQWLEHLAASEGQDTCIFSDVGDLKGTHADCKRHMKKCPILKVMLSDWGFSCKNFSKMFSCKDSGKGS